MITVHIRKQGGAAIMTIPSDVLRMLNVQVGSTLELDVTPVGFIARPIERSRKRYSLKALLKGTTPKAMKALHERTKWVRDGKSVGRELP